MDEMYKLFRMPWLMRDYTEEELAAITASHNYTEEDKAEAFRLIEATRAALKLTEPKKKSKVQQESTPEVPKSDEPYVFGVSGGMMVGKRIGSWTVVEYLGKRRYLCRCSCGAESPKTAGTINRKLSRESSCRNCFNLRQLSESREEVERIVNEVKRLGEISMDDLVARAAKSLGIPKKSVLYALRKRRRGG